MSLCLRHFGSVFLKQMISGEYFFEIEYYAKRVVAKDDDEKVEKITKEHNRIIVTSNSERRM